jgi:predicted RNase H-like nuclease (RuvC/YqgF family)
MVLLSQQSQMSAHPVNKPPVTAKSHSQVVSRLKKRIHQLEAENKELKRKNEALAGQVYRVHSLQAQVERQQEIIANLEARLQDNPKAEVIPITSKTIGQRRDSIKKELDSLGIKLNDTLNKKIKANTEEVVLAAIEALKDQLKRGEVKNPGGWLAKAIEGGWTKAESIPQQQPVTQPEIFKSSSEPEKELVSVEKLKALSSIFFRER